MGRRGSLYAVGANRWGGAVPSTQWGEPKGGGQKPRTVTHPYRDELKMCTPTRRGIPLQGGAKLAFGGSPLEV